MTIIERLPLEIIQRIFEYTDQIEADQCLYLFKAWYPLLRSIYFKEMTWSRYGLLMLKEKLSKINETASPLQIMPMTKRLKIHYDVDDDESEIDVFDDEGNWIDSRWASLSTRLTETEFILLLSHFPNLECLDLKQSTHSIHYTKILVNYQGRKQLPPLEDIKMANVDGPDLCRLNFALSHRFRHSLKAMTITYVEDLDDGSSFLKTLPDFTSLRSLDVVVNDTDPNLTLFHLLRACPSSVASITYECRLRTTPVDPTEELAILRESKEDLSLLKNLTHIKLTLSTITTAYIDFFANHSPQGLTSIDLSATQTNMYTWIDTISMDVALKFCRSLQKFSSVKMKFTHFNRDNNRAAVGVEASRALNRRRDAAQIDIFYHILDALVRGRDLKSTTAVYNSRHVAGESFNIVNGLGIMYQYRLDDDDDSGVYSCLARRFQDCTLPTPSSSLSLAHLAQLKQITVQSGYGEIDCLPANFLDFVKRYCPKLKHFELQPQIIGHRFQAVCRDPIRSSLENATHVLMENAVYSQALFDSVNEYFPRVESLSFGIDNTTLYMPNAKLEFNLSKFKHLDTFIINIEKFPVNDNTGDLVFIEFCYTESKRMMRYLVKKMPAVPDGNESAYEFQPIISTTTTSPQEQVDPFEKRHTYVIHVEGLPRLSSIQVKDPHSAPSILDLSQVSSVLSNNLSLST